ncbi:hypothetical protein ACFPH6_48160 [Streptomyces xiangluensis]|uniref:Uncharacterized protein n=1 Tax=Streptomyces xiangluensis TaxID=2665720 RepID=A0ABV8Z5A9_9ACTN
MITEAHVRALLNREDDAVLVLLRGRAEVVPAPEVDSERCRGAMTVMSGRELRERLGSDRSAPGDLKAVAATLDAMVTEQGG